MIKSKPRGRTVISNEGRTQDAVRAATPSTVHDVLTLVRAAMLLLPLHTCHNHRSLQQCALVGELYSMRDGHSPRLLYCRTQLQQH